MSSWIEVVDDEGELLVSIQTHWMPNDMSVSDLVSRIIPGLSEIYDAYTIYEIPHNAIPLTVH